MSLAGNKGQNYKGNKGQNYKMIGCFDKWKEMIVLKSVKMSTLGCLGFCLYQRMQLKFVKELKYIILTYYNMWSIV